MTPNRSTTLLILSGLGAPFLLVVGGLVIYNVRVKNEETSKLLNATSDVIKENLLSESLRAIQHDRASDIEAFEALVLTRDKLASLLESVEKAGKTLGLDTRIVSVDQVEGDKSIEPHMVRVTVEGTGPWTPTLAFLRVMENLPHRVTIESSKLSKENSNWNLRVVLLLYLFD